MPLLRTFLPLLLLATFSPVIAQPLPRSAPEAQGVSSAGVLAFVEAADRVDAMHSFMLVRHGHVVAEGWWAPYAPDRPHMLYSLSKSFTSTAVGLAIAEGRLRLDDPVLGFFPDDAPAAPGPNLQAMRVHDLLRMATGHQTEPNLQSGETWTRAFLAHDVPFKPGTHFLYNTPATYMLSAIVQKVTGQTVLDYLRPRLFEPLGIEKPTWGTSPQGVTLGGYGLNIRTEDIARFGQLYLQHGRWNGRQLVPEAWTRAATSMQVANGSNPLSDWDQGYGYQFWRSRYNAFRGDGAFGQYCLVIPERDAVVAITSGVRDMQAVMNLVWDLLLPALADGPLPEDRQAQERLTSRLTGLTMAIVEGRATAPAAKRSSGRWYTFPTNDYGIEAMQLDFSGATPVLTVRTTRGESRIPVGYRRWETGSALFAGGLEGRALEPTEQAVAASGAWTADDTYTVRLALYETPYYATLTFGFGADRLAFDSALNVSFGPTRLPRIEGQAR